MEKVEYYETAATRNMHALPRFGHSNSFAYLFGSKEQQTDYIYGLLFAGVFIYAWFIVWCVLLLVFKCLGQRKMGYLSGSPMKISYGSKKPMIIRIVFIISGIIIATFLGLLISKGFTQLKAGVGQVYDGATELDRILGDVNTFVNSIEEASQVAGPLVDELVSQLGNDSFCPGVDLNAQTGIDDFDSILNDTVTTLDGVDNFTLPQSNVVEETLGTAQQTTDNVQNTADNITPKDWQSLIFIVPFSLFIFLFFVGTALAWRGKTVARYSCFLTWVVMPLFIVWVVICCICSGAIALAASANADFCSGGVENTPEGTIADILAINGYTEEDLMYKVVTFYIGQCDRNVIHPLDFIAGYENQLEQTDNAVKKFEEALQNITLDNLALLCSGENVEAIDQLVDEVLTRTVNLIAATFGVLDALACETIMPLYTSTFYNGTCEYSVQGVTWTFAAFLVMAVFGMLMITFRTALLPAQEEEEMYKFADGEEAPMEYNDAQEVDYDPANALSLKESNVEESYGLEQAGDNTGANVATGVAVGAATAGVAVAGAAAYGSSIQEDASNEQPVNESVEQVVSSEQDEQQADPASFDDQNWLQEPAPVGSQY